VAEAPEIKLRFYDPPTNGFREVNIPEPLPEIGDDIDWLLRDYDGFRMFMLEELAAKFPERKRWTPADIEVVLVEALAAVLDQLSDMADRVASEAFLETARRPDSVRRLLKFIGYDAVIRAGISGSDSVDMNQQLERHWMQNPYAMEKARKAGLRSIHTPMRMVTATDYTERLEEHPLVLRADAREAWAGSWNTLHVGVIAWGGKKLDDACPDSVSAQMDEFYKKQGIASDKLAVDASIRARLQYFLNTYRMLGQEVWLEDTVPVGIYMDINVRVAENYYQSELRHAVNMALSNKRGGFFEPGKMRFGEDLHQSDIFQLLMNLNGVQWVKISAFRRVNQSNQELMQADIRLDGLEIIVCDNDPNDHKRGYFKLKLNGGRRG